MHRLSLPPPHALHAAVSRMLSAADLRTRIVACADYRRLGCPCGAFRDRVCASEDALRDFVRDLVLDGWRPAEFGAACPTCA